MTSHVFYAITLCSYDLGRLLDAPGHLGEGVVGLVHGHGEHGETKDEYHHHRQKLSQVHHQAGDDDGPGPKEAVERQEVQDLDATAVNTSGEKQKG